MTWLLPAAVISVDTIWKIQTAFGSPPPSRVRFPVIPSEGWALVVFQTPAGRVWPPISAIRTAPPAAPAAALYAVVKAPWAVMATESPAWNAPVIDAGGPNPVIAVPGDTPTSPLTVVAVPLTLVTVEPPRIPKLQAAPNVMGGGGTPHVTEVVNIHTLLAASAIPNVSCAPVVIVAVKVVLGGRGPDGVNVATMVATT